MTFLMKIQLFQNSKEDCFMSRFDFVWKKFDNANDVTAHINLLYELNEKHGYISLKEAKEVIERLIAGEDLADIEESLFFRIF